MSAYAPSVSVLPATVAFEKMGNDMEDPSGDSLSHENAHEGDAEGDADADDDGIVFAAQAAADAVVEADALDAQHRDEEEEEEEVQQEPCLVCGICGRDGDDGRPMLHFLPVEHDLAAATAAPEVISFPADIALHVFCGKTASILPTVNQPQLEILTKAGLKNKHGIGAEVNAALARTRCAIHAQEGGKEKHYYLVREFEAHLAAIRHTHVSFESEEPPDRYPDHQEVAHAPRDHHHHDNNNNHQQQHHLQHASLYESLKHLGAQQKSVPMKASAGQMYKPGHRQRDTALPYGMMDDTSNSTEDGKIRCGCGGTHLATGTPRGVQSWRNHVITKRHQKWMEDNGLLGAV